MSKTIRLDKYLSDMTSETRSKVKEYIRKGRVTANGVVVKSSETKVDIDNDEICIDGKSVGYVEYYYYMMNKPQGVITSTEKGRTKTVMDVFKETGTDCPRFDELSPVGRLDKDTEGLLLLTNDGQLSHNLLSPNKHVDKKYYVELKTEITAEMIEKLENGIKLEENFITKNAKIEVMKDEKNIEKDLKKVFITITEGKFHQVKRMFKAVNNEVLYLKRVQMGNLKLDKKLSLGEYRELTENELRNLKI